VLKWARKARRTEEEKEQEEKKGQVEVT